MLKASHWPAASVPLQMQCVLAWHWCKALAASLATGALAKAKDAWFSRILQELYLVIGDGTGALHRAYLNLFAGKWGFLGLEMHNLAYDVWQPIAESGRLQVHHVTSNVDHVIVKLQPVGYHGHGVAFQEMGNRQAPLNHALARVYGFTKQELQWALESMGTDKDHTRAPKQPGRACLNTFWTFALVLEQIHIRTS